MTELAESPRDGTAATLRDLLRYFLGLGTWGFGGPIATVGYMQRDLVERREWIDRDEFLNGVALGQTMPGPLAAQVAMWVGFLKRGALGALAVSIAFILPSFVLVLGIVVLYAHYAGLRIVQDLFYGIAPGVMAIIAIAAVKLARLNNKSNRGCGWCRRFCLPSRPLPARRLRGCSSARGWRWCCWRQLRRSWASRHTRSSRCSQPPGRGSSQPRAAGHWWRSGCSS